MPTEYLPNKCLELHYYKDESVVMRKSFRERVHQVGPDLELCGVLICLFKSFFSHTAKATQNKNICRKGNWLSSFREQKNTSFFICLSLISII
jgi:hypothetical protein